jgi:GDP-L-fucose synthase
MKILVTGGSGLLGKNLQEILPNAHYISSKECDLRNADEVNNLMSDIKPSHVIHLASRVGGLFANKNNPVEFFEDNIKINTNILSSAYRHGVVNLIGMLSTCVFPDTVEYPLQSHKMHLGEPHHSNFGYAYAKRMMEVQIRAYRRQYGVNWTTLIPTNVYGKFDNFNIDQAHVIPALIHKCYLAKQNNTEFFIMGNGEAYREFIYAEDLARIIKWAITEYTDEEPLIVSTPMQYSIKEIVYLIADIMQFTGDIVFEGKVENNGQIRKPSDITKLENLFHPEYTSVDEGLRHTIKWFTEYYNTSEIRK